MSEPLCDNTALPVALRRTPRLVRGVVLFLVLLVLAPSLRAQQIIAEPQVVQTSIQPKPHNPTKALLLSLVPGAGQIYNGQAWKIPIIYGALGGVGYFVYTNYTNMMAFKNEYLHRVNGGTPQMEGYTTYPNSSIYNLYQSNNKNFQLFVIISAAVYGLNLIDAYVFGHLYDFQVNDDLSLRLSPSLAPDLRSPYGLSPALQLTFNF